jgi:hypothetical protein
MEKLNHAQWQGNPKVSDQPETFAGNCGYFDHCL